MITFITEAISVLRLSCREHGEVISRACDHELPAGARFGMSVHQTYCTGCRRLSRWYRVVTQGARNLPPGQVPHPAARMPADVRERLGRFIASSKRNGGDV
ncbi:MAG: hypothetical protein JSR77_15195 [Planctomycetes bacterium]|nr:hypothetical protein [Planctomycetota bacterium]